jgi:OHCU decarboxylase
MRADPSDYQLVAPENLQDVVALLAREPGTWLPIAGGTDVMVLYGAGKLPGRNLVSIRRLRELRGIEELPAEIVVGAGCTYTELRQHSTIAREFPMLASAASWTGGIANQNRGTLGGNIANASPAADSLPALLAYDAELVLVSVRGERRIAYRDFHLGYKKTGMAADELIRAICLPRKFAGYFSFARKIGARRAQAIAKISIAGLGRIANGVITDVHIALGSVAPVPLRLTKTESALAGKGVGSLAAEDLRRLIAAEISPIADIRSTAEYRATVAANLVGEFLQGLTRGEASVSERLAQWNSVASEEAAQSILSCCGSHAWAQRMVARRPFDGSTALLEASREIWRSLDTDDWLEAFRSHPRIGESRAAPSAAAQSQEWSTQEQRQVTEGESAVRTALEQGNREYEERFGRIFIVCATGKSPEEILQILHRRLQNDEAVELQEAADEQQQITQIRLRKWLEE